MKYLSRVIGVAAILGFAFVGTAHATSGPGCLRVVNIDQGDALNMRAKPSATSEIMDSMTPHNQGILVLTGVCGPKSRPWAQRWCPVKRYLGDRTTVGYVKARYVRDNDCP